jgi:hypothetical protein
MMMRMMMMMAMDDGRRIMEYGRPTWMMEYGRWTMYVG